MSRLLVLSDSHGNSTRLQKILDNVDDYQYIIHCGDGAHDLLNCVVPKGVKKIQVLGNVDLWRDLPFEREEIFEINNFRFLITHGDLYNVKNGYGLLTDILAERECHGVFFGHTHIKYYFHENFYYFNPGPSSHGVFGIVDVKDNLTFTHYKIDE